MKIRFISFYSKVISFILALLGFASYDSNNGGGMILSLNMEFQVQNL
jgi:hypothetical protein